MNRAALIERLIVHEGLHLKAYDDKTGHELRVGDTLKGCLTCGIGRNLTDRGITESEARYLAGNDIGIAEMDLDRNAPWWRGLNETRQQVLAEMTFNMGWPRLAGFTRFLAALSRNDFAIAAQEMLSSVWASQVGRRAVTLADAMRAGTFDLIA